MSAAPIYHEPRRQGSPQRNRKRTPNSSPLVNSLRVGLVYTIVFTAVCCVTLGFSSLVGYSMKENARQEAIRAGQRAKSARLDVGRIRKRLERLTTMKSVDAWTRDNGFVASYAVSKQPVKPIVVVRPTLFAKNDSGLKIDVFVARIEDGTEAR